MTIQQRLDLPVCPFCAVAPVSHPTLPTLVKCPNPAHSPGACPLAFNYTPVSVWEKLGAQRKDPLFPDVAEDLRPGALTAGAALVSYYCKDDKLREGAGAVIFRGDLAIGLVHQLKNGTIVWHQSDIDVPLRASTLLNIGAFMRRYPAEIVMLEQCHKRHPNEPIYTVTVQLRERTEHKGAIYGS